MYRLIALTIAALLMLPTAARADIIYTLGINNLPGATDGPGPYGFVRVQRIDNDDVKVTFYGTSQSGFEYAFTEMGMNLNTAGFTGYGTMGFNQLQVGPVSYALAPGSNPNQTPTFSTTYAGTLNGFGNFNFHENVNPSGTSAALAQASFNLHRTVGTWLTELSVLTPNVNGYSVGTHLVVNRGLLTGYAVNNASVSCAGGACPVINPLAAAAPEPATLALLGVGLLGLACTRRRAPL